MEGVICAQVPARLPGRRKATSAPSPAPPEEGGDRVPNGQKVWMLSGIHPSPRAPGSELYSFPDRKKKID